MKPDKEIMNWIFWRPQSPAVLRRWRAGIRLQKSASIIRDFKVQTMNRFLSLTFCFHLSQFLHFLIWVWDLSGFIVFTSATNTANHVCGLYQAAAALGLGLRLRQRLGIGGNRTATLGATTNEGKPLLVWMKGWNPSVTPHQYSKGFWRYFWKPDNNLITRIYASRSYGRNSPLFLLSLLIIFSDFIINVLEVLSGDRQPGDVCLEATIRQHSIRYGFKELRRQ